MHKAHNSETPVARDNPGYEVKDASTRPIFVFLAGLLVLLVLVFFGVEAFFNFLNTRSRQGVQSPTLLTQPDQMPPQPRLQVKPNQDLQQFRAKEAKTLNSYGWIDKDAGVVRIPIDRAMDLMLQRGVPTRQPAPTTGKEAAAR